jgi:hypothetical protein
MDNQLKQLFRIFIPNCTPTMKKPVFFMFAFAKILVGLSAFMPISLSAQPIPFPEWKHHVVDSMLPGSAYGTAGFAFADLDGDGDPDITVSRREIDSGRIFWYENLESSWRRHDLGISDEEQLGAAVSDINYDGYPDLVVSRFWLKNPGVLKQNPDSAWERYRYNGGLPSENHDIAAFDADNDGREEILCYSQQAGRGTLRLFKTGPDEEWTYHDLSDSVNATVADRQGSNGIHGGFAPQGIGDLDGDGFADVVMPAGWYRNPGKKSREWKFQPWDFQSGRIPNLYGISMRSWVTDMDGDNDNDVVYVDCDNEGSEGFWLKNNGHGRRFERIALPSPGMPAGSFHSLAVVDFDGDGDPDIFSGEQEDPDKGMKPEGLKERGFFWVNTGTKRRPVFQIVIIQEDNPGWHDVLTGDADRDGDIDLVSKVWNKDGRYYHVDLWENLLRK